jgi:ABC-type multidrug transport system permease subunit
VYFSVIECFLSKQTVITSHKLNNLLMSPSKIYEWVIGQTVGINLFYTCTIFISASLVSLIGGVEISLMSLILIFALAYTTSFSFNMLVFALQLNFDRAFHTLNFSMDIIQFLACVMYPLSVIPMYLKGFSAVIPITWSNELLRTHELHNLVPWVITNILLIFISFLLVKKCISSFKQRGGLYA